MSRFPVLRRSLVELRWQVFWFGLGLAAYAAVMVWFYPQFEDSVAGLADGYPEGLLDFFGGGDLSTASGFLTLEYQSFAVVIFIIYGVIASTGLLAGREGRGELEILLAQPVARRRLILETGGACLLGALGIVALTCAGWLLSVPFVALDDLGLLDLVGASLGALPVVLCFAALGFLVGAIAPSRGSAAGVLTVLVIAAYLVASLAQAVGLIAWARYLSPYYYSDAARWLTDGPVWWHQAALLAGAMLAFALAVRAFERREIDAGRWQWRALVAYPPRRAQAAEAASAAAV